MTDFMSTVLSLSEGDPPRPHHQHQRDTPEHSFQGSLLLAFLGTLGASCDGRMKKG
jgi:hypothetical protein